MPRKAARHLAASVECPEEVAIKEQTEPVLGDGALRLNPVSSPAKRGRKLKYESDDERRQARRLQNRQYRERKKQELINLRRAAVKATDESSQVDAVALDEPSTDVQCSTAE